MSIKERVNSYHFQVRKTEVWEFFEFYDDLTPLQKDIWALSCWFVRNKPVAIPSQAYLAKKANCCRKTVNQTLNLFASYGWLTKIDRGARRCKRLLIPDHLVNAHFADRKFLRRPEVTREVTPILSSKNKNTTHGDGILKIQEWVKNLGISEESKLKISLFPEQIFQDTLRQLKNLAKTGFKAHDEEAYFIGTMKKIAEKRRFKPKWYLFYQRQK